MLKIKLLTVLVFSILAVIALSSSRNFTASANEDILQEIAEYKTWQKMNKEPIKVAAGVQSNNETVFIIDGEDVSSFRTGALNG